MKKKVPKFYKILKSLPADELRKVRKMFQSPFFTSNPALLKLYDAIYPYVSGSRVSQPSKEAIYQKIFPEQEFSNGKWRNLVSECTKLTEEFLVLKEKKEDEFEQQLTLLEIYRKKNADELYELTERKLLSMLETAPCQDAKYYKNADALNTIRLEKLNPKRWDEMHLLLNRSLENLESYYQISKVIIGAKRTSLKYLAVAQAEPKFEYQENIIFKIYTEAEKMTRSGQIESFKIIKRLLFSNTDRLPEPNLVEVFQMLLNFCLRAKKDSQNISSELLDLYLYGLKERLLIVENRISGLMLINIILSACKEHDTDLAKRLIIDYKQFLNPVDREDLIKLGESYIYYYQRELQKALNKLSTYFFTSSILTNMARLHLLVCQFEVFINEQSNYEELESHINAFEGWVKRVKEFTEDKRKANILFIKFLKRLIDRELRKDFSMATTNGLMVSLKKEGAVFQKYWLERMILRQQ